MVHKTNIWFQVGNAVNGVEIETEHPMTIEMQRDLANALTDNFVDNFHPLAEGMPEYRMKALVRKWRNEREGTETEERLEV